MWYTIKLVFRIEIAGKRSAQFDEQVRLVEAANETEAFEKAQAIGHKQQVSFTGSNNLLRKWIFIGTAAIVPLKELASGTQCFSLTTEVDEPETYTNFVKERSKQFEQKLSLTTLV
ncbi:MAG TPA: DUF4288 domain-containing protein [Flavobacteriales bacterium]|nr:DUF4288 domain-containing protein [Flavobacteriales bacterium]